MLNAAFCLLNHVILIFYFPNERKLGQKLKIFYISKYKGNCPIIRKNVFFSEIPPQFLAFYFKITPWKLTKKRVKSSLGYVQLNLNIQK